RLSAPLAISGASVTIYSLLDKLMIGYFQGASPVGIYSIARNLLETSLFPTFALVMTLRPALAGAWAAGDGDRCRYLVRRSLMDSFFYATCVILVFGCLSGPLVTGIFSDRFAESARILVIFLPLIMMRSLGSVILPGLIAADRAGTYARLTLAGAALNFILNILLIPEWGAEGAVVSTLVSYMPIEVLGLRALWKAMPGFWKMTDWVRVAKGLGVAAAIAAAHRYLAPPAGSLLTAVIHAAAITAVYTALVIATGALSRSEFASMLGPVLRRRGR
ncbi:MAG TPA: polysaccharide biosynthesis C-terminal domain-containing protein, partial [Candidatus Krumholzibacterium sp.]|nr:polysaccharide biosynthesis C-terminal domain-containing protein [Candidatus Krumholzibacterium sp.]